MSSTVLPRAVPKASPWPRTCSRVVGALDTNPVLRRVLSDPASEGEAKAGLVRSLFGDKIGSGALEIVSTAAQAAVGRVA